MENRAIQHKIHLLIYKPTHDEMQYELLMYKACCICAVHGSPTRLQLDMFGSFFFFFCCFVFCFCFYCCCVFFSSFDTRFAIVSFNVHIFVYVEIKIGWFLITLFSLPLWMGRDLKLPHSSHHVWPCACQLQI